MQMYVTGSFPLTYSELRQISVLKKNEQFHLKLGNAFFFWCQWGLNAYVCRGISKPVEINYGEEKREVNLPTDSGTEPHGTWDQGRWRGHRGCQALGSNTELGPGTMWMLSGPLSTPGTWQFPFPQWDWKPREHTGLYNKPASPCCHSPQEPAVPQPKLVPADPRARPQATWQLLL